MIVPVDLYTVCLGIAWSRNVPHRHMVDYYIKKITETGQLNRIRRIWLHTSGTECAAGAGFSPMGLQNMVSGFALISLGALIAALIFLMEMVMFKFFN